MELPAGTVMSLARELTGVNGCHATSMALRAISPDTTRLVCRLRAERTSTDDLAAGGR